MVLITKQHIFYKAKSLADIQHILLTSLGLKKLLKSVKTILVEFFKELNCKADKVLREKKKAK